MFPTTLRRRTDGLQNLRRLSTALDDAFSDTFGNGPFGQRFESALTAAWVPACDIFEDKDGIKLVMEVPGVDPGDVNLQLENNVLTIRGDECEVSRLDS